MTVRQLTVHLLGGFGVELDGETLYGFESDKARALLAYLVTETDRPHRRETLAGLLWPDRPEVVARANLRQALSCVRRVLGDPRSGDPAPPSFLFVTSTDVQFNTHSTYTLDVAELEAIARSPERREKVLPAELCGDLLAGFAVPDSEVFQSWLLNKQEYCHRLALDILEDQTAAFERAGEYAGAVAAARLQLQMEPWLEEAHRSYMRALALTGRRDEALRQYDVCCRVLQAELGVDPSASTQALHTAILSGELRVRNLISLGQPAAGPAPATSGRPPPTLPQLVARAQEMDLLNSYLAAARAGQTCLAFISGEAGSGKTMLLEAFATAALTEHPELLIAGARCSPGGDQDPLAPLRRLAETLFGDFTNHAGWHLQDSQQTERLRQATDLVLSALDDHGRYLVNVLLPATSVARRGRLAFGHAPAWLGELAEQHSVYANSQGVLFDQLMSTLAAITRERTLLLLLDDLHWVDDASAAFLLNLGRELKDSRLLILGAYRSNVVALGRRNPQSGQVERHPMAAVVNELRRLNGEILVELERADGRAFVEAYVDTEPNRLGARFRDALYAQTGGQALFTVEVLRNLQARGDLVKDEAGRWTARESLNWQVLPARVEATIAERIERLSEASRRILSAASVQGDDFSAEVVAKLTGIPADELRATLSGSLARQHHLVQPEGLQNLGDGRQSIYRFTHHLFQKYLYDQLDPVERARLHGGVAESLDRQVAGDVTARERIGAQLAWHYGEAGLPLQTARALLDAGREAMRMSAFREALLRYDRGLALLAAAPPSQERAGIGRLLEVARLGPERNLEGLSSAKLLDTVARATAAWGGHVQGQSQLLILATVLEHCFTTGRFEDSLAAFERLQDAATVPGTEPFAGLAHFYFGANHHYLGNLRLSETGFAQVRAFLTPERRAKLRGLIGLDVEVIGLAISARNLWLLGYPEQALARSRQALASARVTGAALGQAGAMALGAGLLHCLRHDEPGAAELTEECYRLSQDHGLVMWMVYSEVLRGWVQFGRGEDLAGIEHMWGVGWQYGNVAIETDFFATMVADSCLTALRRRGPAAGAISQAERSRLLTIAQAAIDRMLGPSHIPCGRLYEAELRRLQGELLLERDGLAAAEAALACFSQAQQLGRETGALVWQLRATMSLVRLRERQGSGCAAELAEARRALAKVFASYTEGFDFPDLQDAAALLRTAAPRMSEPEALLEPPDE